MAGVPHPDLAAPFEALNDGDKMVLASGAKYPGSLVLVDKGSEHDLFLEKLAALGLADAVDVQKKFRPDRLAGWRITPEGSKVIIPMFKDE